MRYRDFYMPKYDCICFVALWMLGMLLPAAIRCQPFYFGADLSYVNEMEECGAIYTVEGESRDVFSIFNEYGCNLVRLRLWHTPSWYDGLNAGQRYSDFADIRTSIGRARSEGMQVLLAFHLSDTWADPGHQVAPAAWSGILHDLPVLEDSLYQYIYTTLEKLAEDQLFPEIVQIGNETNKGILQSQQDNDAGWSLNWPRNRALFNTAIRAVRDIETAHGIEIKVALHVADPDDASWLLAQFWSNGVRDFDIIGLSYYYSFHQVLIPFVGERIAYLKDLYPGKEVMLLETAYPWTNNNADGANNVLGSGYPGYTPPSPARQLDWMIALTQEVMDHGGKGVVYWEPAWVSTDCFTQWAMGSHWDNATFFNASHELIESGGIGWMTHMYDPVSVRGDNSFMKRNFSIYHDGKGLWLSREEGNMYMGEMGVQLYAMDGRRIMGRRMVSGSENGIIFLGVPEVVSGVYMVIIESGDVVEGVRVVIWK